MLKGGPWLPSLTACPDSHCLCSCGSRLSQGLLLLRLGEGLSPTRTVLWLLQEHSRTHSSQQMLPPSTLQPSPSPSAQRSLSVVKSWEAVHRGRNPALEAACPLGEWQEQALTTVAALDGDIPPGAAALLTFSQSLQGS